MRILQGNLNRSRTANELLIKLLHELKIDLVIISEQFRNREALNWYADVLGTAAMWVVDTQKFLVKRNGSGRGFVWGAMVE